MNQRKNMHKRRLETKKIESNPEGVILILHYMMMFMR